MPPPTHRSLVHTRLSEERKSERGEENGGHKK